MLIGIPLISNQKHFDFHKFLNTSLDQHEHVGQTEIPIWKSSEIGILVEKTKIENPLLLFIINPNYEATFMSLKGTCYHVGKVLNEPCILIIHLSRNNQYPFMGGKITILDVLYFDNENLMVLKYKDRMKQFRFLHTALNLPKRYTISQANHGKKNNEYDAWNTE